MSEPTEQDALEEKIYDEQEKWIHDNISPGAAQDADYGWGVDEVEGYIQTKIYGDDGGVLTTTFSEPEVHEFEPWG